MSDKTGIEWTDATWNPIRGCSRVSEGCRNCYAEGIAQRFGGAGLPYEGVVTLDPQGKPKRQWSGNVRLIGNSLMQPLRWKRPRKIFVNSMSDLFHPEVLNVWLDQIFAVMLMAPHHTFQVLTKRPERMLAYLSSEFHRTEINKAQAAMLQTYRGGSPTMHAGNALNPNQWPLKNVWLGVSVESQQVAKERIWPLLKTPAAVRFVSAEPLLGALDLNEIEALCRTWRRGFTIGTYLDWVIVGGESGRGARPMKPEWAQQLRDQCAANGVAFFFKQGSKANWQPYKDFEKFPRELQVREFPACNSR